MESDWFKGTRLITDTENGIKIVDELIVKKDKVTNDILKSQAYEAFQNKVYGCFGDTALVYKQ